MNKISLFWSVMKSGLFWCFYFVQLHCGRNDAQKVFDAMCDLAWELNLRELMEGLTS